MLSPDEFRKWLGAGKKGQASKRPEGRFEAEHEADFIASVPNPLAELEELGREYSRQTYMGMDHNGFVLAPPDTHTLAIGPARSSGKSSGWMCPAIILHVGPAIVCSAKMDNFKITAMARAFVGAVWVFSVTPTPELHGVIHGRWSLVVGAQDWDTAVHTATAAIKASGPPGGAKSDSGHFFDSASSALLAVMLFVAANYEFPPFVDDPEDPLPPLPQASGMRWVVQTLMAGRIDTHFIPLLPTLYGDGHIRAAQGLEAFLRADAKTADNILTSVVASLKPYQLEGVLDAADDPNLDPAQFVRTDWSEPNNFDGTVDANPQLEAIGIKPNVVMGRYDTLYILTGTDPSLTAPIVEALLSQLRHAAQKQFEHMDIQGKGRPANVLFAIDELGSGAFLGDLDQLLAIAGVGVQVIACIQSFEQLSHRYGENIAKGFLTLFSNLLVWPGCRSIDLLNLITALGGKYEREIWSMSNQRNAKGKSEQVWSMSYRESDLHPPYAVYRGHQSSPDSVLYLPHNGTACYYVYNTPYFRCNPWPATLIRAAAWTLRSKTPNDLRVHLPLPNLDWDGKGTHLRGIDKGLYDEYLTTSSALVNAQRNTPALPATPHYTLRKAG